MLKPPGALAGPTLRATARGPLPAALALLAAPVLVTLARGHHDLAAPTTFLAIAGAACISFSVDDPTEGSLDACPTTRAARRGVLAALIVAGLAVTALTVAGTIAAAGAHGGPVRLPEIAAAGALSLAAAARAARVSHWSPGFAAAAGTVLAMATSTVLSNVSTVLARLPRIGDPSDAASWWGITVVAGSLAWWWSRDPASRGPLTAPVIAAGPRARAPRALRAARRRRSKDRARGRDRR